MQTHQEKVRAEVARRGLVSLMNETRWRELREGVLAGLAFPPPFQRKDVLAPEPEPAGFEEDIPYWGDWSDGILPFYSIEWIRVRARPLHQRSFLLMPEALNVETDFRELLVRHRIPWQESAGSIWIYGYSADTASRFQVRNR